MNGITRKEEIIQTAAALFKAKGFSAVSMRDLAKAMGIKAASLYNHIDSKQHILDEIIISLAEMFTRGMSNIMNSDDNTIEKLKAIVRLHVQISSDHTDGMASLNNDWMHLEQQQDYYLRLREQYEDNFRSIIIDGMNRGDLKRSNPEVVLFSILSTLRSLYLWIPRKEDQLPDELATELSEVLINGVFRH